MITPQPLSYCSYRSSFSEGGPSGLKGGFKVAITEPGDLYTSVEDLFLWDQNFYNNKLGGGGQDLISQELSIGVLNNGERLDHAFGLKVGNDRGLTMIGQSRIPGGFTSEMIRFPDQRVAVMCLCNGNIWAPGLAKGVANILLSDQFTRGAAGVKDTVADAPHIISVPEKELAGLAGLYLDSIHAGSVSFYMQDGKLTKAPNARALSPVGHNRFTTGGGGAYEFLFEPPTAGARMQVKVFSPRIEGDPGSGKTTATYDAVERVTLTSGQLAELAGQYVSDELAGATYTLSIRDGKLILGKDMLLTPAFADVFFNKDDDLYVVTFMRNQKNAVVGLAVSTQGVRGLRFKKR